MIYGTRSQLSLRTAEKNTDEWNFWVVFNLYELIIHLLCLGIADSRPCHKTQLLLYEKQQQQQQGGKGLGGGGE